MKRFTFLVFILCLVSSALFATAKSFATEIVGNESYEVSWDGAPASDNGSKYQVYYGQVDGNKEAYSLFDGLDNRSHKVKLNNLKACTQYSWSVKSKRNNDFNWIIRDRRFTTGGICSTTQTTNNTPVILGNGSAIARWMPINGAKFYNVYYYVCGENNYQGAVRVPDKGGSVEIKYLDPSKTYCYKVAGMVGSKEIFLPDQKLTNNTVSKPVLGVVSPTLSKLPNTPSQQVVLNKKLSQIKGVTTTGCSNIGKATVSFTTPKGVSVAKTHILYGETGKNYQHAVRNLSGKAQSLTINSLNTCVNYDFQVKFIGTDNKVYNQTVQTLRPTN